MKKVLMLALGLTLCAGAAMADHIGLYRELAGLNCNKDPWIPDGASNYVYVLQRFNTGSSSIEFKVNNTSGAPFSAWTLGNALYLQIGTPESGISVAYTMCVATGDIYVMRLRYADDDLTGAHPDPCGKLEVVQDPTAVPPVRQTVDCQGIAEPATGGTFYWGTGCGPCGEVATQPTTWGSVKALYR